MSVWVGTSGWSYNHWVGVLYPPGKSSRGRLDRYLTEFDTVELNSSFYRWPREAAFATWRTRVPAGFRFTVKAPRGLTRAKRLREPEVWIDRLRVGLHELGDRRGVLLVQLPPDQQRDDARLEYFLQQMPTWVGVAVEFRHPSWVEEAVFELLSRYGAAYCVMSGAHLPCILRATADFVYVRLHGPHDTDLYGGSYSENDLQWWADRVGEWQTNGRDVYLYFNNDGEGHAVHNARRLRDILADRAARP